MTQPRHPRSGDLPRGEPSSRGRATIEHRPATGVWPALEIHRSPRRRRSAQAVPQGPTVVVRLPAGLASEEEERLIQDLLRKVTRRARAEALGGDDALRARAEELADRYLDGIRPTSVRWSARMTRLYGSCTPRSGEIRISHQLATVPVWVLDSVLVHELAHLVVPDHSARFHALVARYPEAERARGWLEGFSAGQLAAQLPAPAPPTDLAPPTVAPRPGPG